MDEGRSQEMDRYTKDESQNDIKISEKILKWIKEKI